MRIVMDLQRYGKPYRVRTGALFLFQSAFNFQNNNFNKGGKGNDSVFVSVQNSAQLDNADFATPPE